MNILYTGGNGFVGRWVSSALCNPIFQDDKILALSSAPISGIRTIYHNGYRFESDDIVAAGMGHVDVLIHLGAATPKSKADYDICNSSKFASNVRNTCWLYEHLPNVPKKIIFISSTDVYKNAGYPINEDSPIHPSNLYGSSKVLCEGFLATRSKEDGFDLDVLRVGPIYGEGDYAYGKIVSHFVKTILGGGVIKITGTGEEKRSLLHVTDCVKCIIGAMKKDCSVGVVNIVNGDSISICDLVSTVATVLHKSPNVDRLMGPVGRSDEFDDSIMQKVFPFPRMSVREGVERYVRYIQGGGR